MGGALNRRPDPQEQRYKMLVNICVQIAGTADPNNNDLWNLRFRKALDASGMRLSLHRPVLPEYYVQAPHPFDGANGWPVVSYIVWEWEER